MSTETMKSLMVPKLGNPASVMEIKSIPIPNITSEDDIIVKVHYASFHIGDYKIINGDMGPLTGALGFKVPFIPGQDYSGKIIKIGKNVTNFKVGDSVFGEIALGKGTLCEYILVKESEKEIYKIPNNISMIDAGSIQVSLETAYQALVDNAKITENDSILILGGSTVLGMYCIQIAKNIYNCKNITVTSSKVDLCKSLGATDVINYKEKSWEIELKNKQFTIVLDVMGGGLSWTKSKQNNVLSNKGGRYVTVAGDFEADTVIGCCVICKIMCKVLCCRTCCCKGGNYKYVMVNQDRSKSMDKICELLKENKIKAMIDEDGPWKLDDFGKACEKIKNRNAHGKLMFKLIDDDANNDVNNDDDTKYDQ